MSKTCAWAIVSEEIPWGEWWTLFLNNQKWSQDLLIERWSLAETAWSKIFDSFNSFTLFGQKKVLVLTQADKATKNKENKEEFLRHYERLKKGPHHVVFVSESEPEITEVNIWKCEIEEENKIDDKAIFRWIDSIHAKQLSQAITALDAVVSSGQHPIAILQMLNRDFRLGRLIHHGLKCRIQHVELSKTLKVQPFLIQKWTKREAYSNSMWSHAFDLLFQADLDLKSGQDGVWVLRKLTFDLTQIQTSATRTKVKKVKTTWKPEPLLWTASPSFA